MPVCILLVGPFWWDTVSSKSIVHPFIFNTVYPEQVAVEPIPADFGKADYNLNWSPVSQRSHT